jgi:NADH dehydrogenase
MQRIAFVTGAAGVMGSRVARGLRARGWGVRALVLPGDPLRARLDGAGAEIVEGDVTCPETYAAALRGVDTVYHLAAVLLARDPSAFERVNRRGTEAIVNAAAGASVRHLVYVSSASVTYPRLTRYGASKLAGEEAVRREARLRSTIVRPTLVWDDDGGGEELAAFRRHVTRWPLVPLVGRGGARKRPVHADDVAEALVAIAGHPRAPGALYNLSGPEVVTLREMARLEQRRAGVRRPLVPVPRALCSLAAALLERLLRDPPISRQGLAGLVHDAALDPGLAMRDLGYRPRSYRASFDAPRPPARR